MTGLLRLVLCVLAVGGLAPSAASATTWGISDGEAADLGDPRLRELPIDTARLVVPWDVAYAPPGQADAWLAEAQRLGLDPLVTFGRRTQDRCPTGPCTLPTPAELRAAFTAFRARWPQVRTFGAWNEPNHATQPTATRPEQAAELLDTLDAACPRCTIVAGDVLDGTTMPAWTARYIGALRARPDAWGIHAYRTVTYDEHADLDWLLDHVDGPVWITEAGGIVRFGDAERERLPYDEGRAAAAMRRLVALPRALPRIERVYVHEWRGVDGARFDSGLLRPDGTARPSLDVLRAALGPRPVPQTFVAPGAASGSPAGPGGRGAAAAPARSVTRTGPRPARILRVRRFGRRVRVRVACPATRVRCVGAIVLRRHGRSVARRVLRLGGQRTVAVALVIPRRRARPGVWRVAVRLRRPVAVTVARVPRG